MTRLISILFALMLALPAAGQNMFAPIITINGRVVTRFEVAQRVEFLRAVRSPGDLEAQAEEALINERIQSLAAERASVELTPEELDAGLEEFAGRVNLSTEDFIATLAEKGVARETFRDFVQAGLLWRKYVQSKFTSLTAVTEADIDRQLEAQTSESGARVFLSEIILPTTPDKIDETTNLVAQIKTQVRNEDQFASAARQVSVSRSRERGGRIDPLDLNSLPAQLVPILLTLAPGEVSDPVPVAENAIGLFLLRGLTEIPPRPAANLRLEYATYAIPGGQSPEALARARAVAERIDTCVDLNGIVRGVDEDRLTFAAGSVAEIPRDITLELARLDPNEVSTALTRDNGQTLLFLMLCSRTADQEEDARARARLAVVNARLSSLANGHLEALKADAIIRRP